VTSFETLSSLSTSVTAQKEMEEKKKNSLKKNKLLPNDQIPHQNNHRS
jgi:hypothetical protein